MATCTWQRPHLYGSHVQLQRHLQQELQRSSKEISGDTYHCQRLTCWPGKSYPATATSMPLDLPQSLKSFESRFVYVMSAPLHRKEFRKDCKIPSAYSATLYSPRVHPPTSSTSAPSSPTDTVDIHFNLTQAKPIFLPLFSCCRQLWRQGVCQISGKCHGYLLCTRCFCCPLESLEGQTTAVEPVAWNPTAIRVEGLEAAVQAILVLEVFELTTWHA